MAKKINWKGILGWGALAAFIGCILYFNQPQQAPEGKRNFYAVLPLTGAIAKSGQDCKHAMELYQKQTPDSKVNIVFIDSQLNPTTAVTALQQAILNDENPLVYTHMAAISSAIVPQIDGKGFVIAGSIDVDNFHKFKDYQRITTFSTDAVVEALKLMKKYKRLALIHSNNEYGYAVKKTFEKGLEGTGITYDTLDYDLQDVASVRNIIYKFLRKEYDAVLVSGASTPAFIKIFRELDSQDFKGRIFGDVAFGVPFVLDQLSDITPRITFATSSTYLDEPLTNRAKEFRQMCIDNDITPNVLAVECRDVVAISDYMLKNNIPFKQQSFTDMKQYESATGYVYFTGNGNSEYQYVMATVKDGKVVPVEE